MGDGGGEGDGILCKLNIVGPSFSSTARVSGRLYGDDGGEINLRGPSY